LPVVVGACEGADVVFPAFADLFPYLQHSHTCFRGW